MTSKLEFIINEPANAPKGIPIHCARQVCGISHSKQWYWNYSTRDWYCEFCATRINRAMDANICKPINTKDL